MNYNSFDFEDEDYNDDLPEIIVGNESPGVYNTVFDGTVNNKVIRSAVTTKLFNGIIDKLDVGWVANSVDYDDFIFFYRSGTKYYRIPDDEIFGLPEDNIQEMMDYAKKHGASNPTVIDPYYYFRDDSETEFAFGCKHYTIMEENGDLCMINLHNGAYLYKGRLQIEDNTFAYMPPIEDKDTKLFYEKLFRKLLF